MAERRIQQIFSRASNGRTKAVAVLLLCAFILPVSARELRSKALRGDAVAQFQLGSRYFKEQKNPTLAVYWFRKAAEQNIPLALYHLAVCMEYGWGTPKNVKTALEYYSRLEKNGMKQAAYRRAVLLWEGVFEEIEPQKELALRSLTSLAETYAPARQALIRILWNDPELRKSRSEELRELAEKALAEALPDPEVILINARLHRDGIGAVGNPQKAVELTQKAASLGNPEAKADLASYLEAGYGCKPDPRKAFELIKEAALAGVAEALIRYGEHLLAGDYCPHDPVRGREFIEKGKRLLKRKQQLF